MPALSSGQNLDPRFTLVRPLVRGGMAETWLVHDAELNEEVVAKILSADASEGRVELLRRACREARRLVHPGIARVFEFHRTADRAFLTMEFVDGEDLSDLRGRPLEEILPVALSIARALTYAHSRGVVHRDLKLANVVRDGDGAIRLIDFGIAGRLEDGEKSRPSNDIYSFGVMLDELTTGDPPFPDAEPLPDRFRSLVLRLLAKHPDERPAEMANVESELEGIRRELAGPHDHRTSSEPGRARVSPPPRAKTIEPIRLQTVSGTTDPGGRRSAAVRVGMPIALAAVVIALLLLVFVLLPTWAPSPAREPEESVAPVAADEQTTPASQPELGGDLRERAEHKQRAEEALGRLIELREDFERRGAATWGGEIYVAAVAHADAGDSLLASDDYTAAHEEYELAIRQFDQLGRVAVDLVRTALAEGEKALAAGDEAAATAAFALAAEIAPDSETAANGLRRARVVEEVAELLLLGGGRERAHDWVGAEQAYQQAVAQDPMSLEAQEGLARVQAHVGDDQFAGFMSRGLAALQRGEYSDAREAFERAGSMRPSSLQVAEGLLQVDQAEKLDAFATHQARAMAFEEAEEWESAVEQYAAVIGLAPNVAFARQGQTRCLQRVDLARRMAHHLDHPDRLSSDEVFDEATALVAEASEVNPAGPRHLEQLARLERLVATAGTLVRVRLESDNLTEVAIYRVGRLGAFLEHELELRPGRYTVVGSRAGYRDVRRELVIVAGEQPTSLVVRCEEMI